MSEADALDDGVLLAAIRPILTAFPVMKMPRPVHIRAGQGRIGFQTNAQERRSRCYHLVAGEQQLLPRFVWTSSGPHTRRDNSAVLGLSFELGAIRAWGSLDHSLKVNEWENAN